MHSTSKAKAESSFGKPAPAISRGLSRRGRTASTATTAPGGSRSRIRVTRKPKDGTNCGHDVSRQRRGRDDCCKGKGRPPSQIWRVVDGVDLGPTDSG